MTARRVRIPLLVIVVLILHLTTLVRFRPFGVRLDILILLAVVAGLTGGAERGGAVGFAAGLLGDLYLDTPFGLSALVLSLVGFGTGLIQGGILRATWWIAPVTAFAASIAAVGLYAIAGAMVGQARFVEPRIFLVVAPVVALGNAALAVPMLRAAAWAMHDEHPERSYA